MDRISLAIKEKVLRVDMTCISLLTQLPYHAGYLVLGHLQVKPGLCFAALQIVALVLNKVHHECTSVHSLHTCTHARHRGWNSGYIHVILARPVTVQLFTLFGLQMFISLSLCYSSVHTYTHRHRSTDLAIYCIITSSEVAKYFFPTDLHEHSQIIVLILLILELCFYTVIILEAGFFHACIQQMQCCIIKQNSQPTCSAMIIDSLSTYLAGLYTYYLIL